MKVFLVAIFAMVARTEAQTQAQVEAGIRLMDKNNNGFIEKEEVVGLPAGQAGDLSWKAVVNLGDSNNDGQMSVSEFASYSMKMSSPELEEQRSPDTNHDGLISKDEMVALLGADKVTNSCWQAILKKADKDRDGKIGMQEFVLGGVESVLEACNNMDDLAQDRPPPSPHAYNNDFIDANNDNFLDAYDNDFVDANNDGFVSKDEMSVFLVPHQRFTKKGEFLSDPISKLVSDNCWNEMLEIVDKDMDGRVSMREFHISGPGWVPESCGPSPWPTTPPPTIVNTCGTNDCWNTMLKVADKDGDGKMDATEFQDVAVGFKCLVKSLLLHFLDDNF